MKRNKSFDKGNSPLYLIATPIGNLKEFSSRAIEVVSDADIVAAEDTRNAMWYLHIHLVCAKLFALLAIKITFPFVII